MSQPIPNGTFITTAAGLVRLIYSAPAANCPVVLDRYSNAWILFADEDDETHAATVECPDDGVPERYNIEALADDRGPLYVLFNGDYRALTGRQQVLCACCPAGPSGAANGREDDQ